jgi:uncharacterized protein YhhL (DUF1145 family)
MGFSFTLLYTGTSGYYTRNRAKPRNFSCLELLLPFPNEAISHLDVILQVFVLHHQQQVTIHSTLFEPFVIFSKANLKKKLYQFIFKGLLGHTNLISRRL